MSVTSGTYTFGSGGTYPTFKALLDDWTGSLTGDVVFLKVGNSDDDGVNAWKHAPLWEYAKWACIKSGSPRF
jgi:hypothetical protein